MTIVLSTTQDIPGEPSFKYNHVVRGYLTRDRLHPYRVLPYQCYSGVDDDWETPFMKLYQRERFISSYGHTAGTFPDTVSLGNVALSGPAAMGRLSFDNRKWCEEPDCARPDDGEESVWNAGWPMHPLTLTPPAGTNGWLWTCENDPDHVYPARPAPPRLNPLFWTKFFIHDTEYSHIYGCVGGKIERGAFVRGGFSLLSRNEAGVNYPPHFRPWILHTQSMTPTPDAPNDNDHFGLWRSIRQCADIPEGDQYRYFALLPVYPVSAWSGENMNPPPYPEGAEQLPAIRDARNYEVPCYPRTGDSRRHIDPRDIGTDFLVPGGQRLILAQSSGEPQIATLEPYYRTTHQGNRRFMLETLTRKYQGITDDTHYQWVDDPEERGWGVSYQAIIHVTFAHSYFWHWYGVGGGGPVFRWAMWYAGEVNMRVTGGGDLDDGDFLEWVESHEDRFGLTFEPRYSVCNDVMLGCLGMENALGDTSAPWLAHQQEDQADGHPPPCLAAGYSDGSKWYISQRPASGAGSEIALSSHPITGSPQWPEDGLIHEITRTMRDVDGNATSETQTAYGSAVFAVLGIPRLTIVDEPQVTITNEIQRVVIELDGRPEPDAGEFVVDVTNWDGAYEPVTFDMEDLEGDLTRWCNQAWLGDGTPPTLRGSWPAEPAVVVRRIDTLVWEFEFVNQEAEKRQSLLHLHDYPNRNTLSSLGEIPDPKYTVRVIRVQAGGQYVAE